jgi:membrane-bound ClpP family serine protease
MILDLRIPMGLMFTITGLILTVFGFVTRNNAELYAKSLGVNANLWWGLVLLIFGVTMFLTGKRSQKQLKENPPPPAAEGRMRRGH